MSATPDTSTGSNARERSTLKASTLCEAFQVTAAENAGSIALRTPGGTIELTFAEVAERVKRIAAGLHELGV